MATSCSKAAENPVKKVRLARENNEPIRILSPEEEQRLLDCCTPALAPLVVTALHTGLRASELLSLTWADVDFRRHAVTVRAAYAKNGESRSVPMNAVLLSTLKAVRMTVHAIDMPVFCVPQGTPYKNFRTAFERAVMKASIADFTFHDLRHTFASRLVMNGADLPTVQALMGHKTIAMPLRYTHLTTDHKQRAVRLLEPVAEKVPANFTTARNTRMGYSS
jgi:integrase